jgi:hypothetical protein
VPQATAARGRWLVRLTGAAILGLWLAPARGFAESLEPRTGQALAASFVDALNAGDEEAVVALFDIQATIAADRMAWRAQDVRGWARLQIAERIKLEPTSDYAVARNRVKWTARVSRRDWRQRGVDRLEVWDSILVDHGRILAFMSQPAQSTVAGLLGDGWRPEAPPDPPRETTSELAWPTEFLALVAPLAIAAFAAGIARARRRTRTPRPQPDGPRQGGVRLASLATLAAAKRVRPVAPGVASSSVRAEVGEIELCEVI